MADNKPPLTKQMPEWLRFEHEVAKLFELFGYDEVIHNTKIDGGQCDVFAKSRRRSKANIVAECKYHENPSSKVNIVDVQNFIYKVSNYRNTGKIDQGYLVTNTGFTADARGALSGYIGNYIFLLTYDELIQSLLDINHYLQEYITEYDAKGEGNRYVELKLINTSALDRTLLDSIPGDVIRAKDTDPSYLVVPGSSEVKEQTPFSFSPVNPIHFVEKLRERHIHHATAIQEYNHQLIQCLSEAVKEVAIEMEDQLLEDTFNALPEDIFTTISRSPEAVLDMLLNNRKQLADDDQFVPYDRSYLKENIKLDITARFYSKLHSIALKKIPDPPTISTFEWQILEALKIKVDDVEWTDAENFEKKINQLKQTADKAPPLHLLFEEDATPAFRQFIHADPASTLVLIGDYGAGKTTILRRLMRYLAEEKLSRPHDPSCRIPLLISLKDYNKVPDIQSLIRLFLQNIMEGDTISIRTFRKLNEDGRFVLLLDAFDEMLTRVTKADRRRCFREIADLVSRNSKIILSGRPAYFNDYKELRESLNILQQPYVENEKELSTQYEVMCLQLLDEEKVEQLIEKASPRDFKSVLEIILKRPDLMDLARRPVLASIIAQTGKELIKLENKKISARSIYEVYTNKWIQREEDKGEFRLLLHPEQKSTFLRYLATQMYLSGSLLIHYAELDKSVASHFDLDSIVEVDHFSHDIRTCSFLSRTDDGYYFFIHKSFMEYFVACEFERKESSPFADKFTHELAPEIIDLLDFDLLPKSLTNLLANRDQLRACIEYIKMEKNRIVKSQKFDHAAFIRELEKECISMSESMLEKYNSFFTMEPDAVNSFIDQFRKKLQGIFSQPTGFKENDLKPIKDILNTQLADFNLNL